MLETQIISCFVTFIHNLKSDIIFIKIGVKRRKHMTIWMLLLKGIILYFIFYSVYARLVEKRSVISRIFQDSLTIGNFLFSSMMSKGLKNLRQKGRKPFVWPE